MTVEVIANEGDAAGFNFAPEKGALNQYWYSDNTIEALAGQRLKQRFASDSKTIPPYQVK